MGRAGHNTETVVATACELADEAGFEALTLAHLAARLGIRTPSLYAHVNGLADLQRRVANCGTEALGRALADAVAGRAGADALTAAGRAYRTFAHRHPGLWAAVERAPVLEVDPELARGPVEAVAAALRGYGLEGDGAIHGVRIVRAALRGFVAIESSGGFGIDLDPDTTFDRLLATLDRGLAP